MLTQQIDPSILSIDIEIVDDGGSGEVAPYVAERWNGMRIVGIILLVGSTIVHFSLLRLARERRRKIEEWERGDKDVEEGRHHSLANALAVDKLLEVSATFSALGNLSNEMELADKKLKNERTVPVIEEADFEDEEEGETEENIAAKEFSNDSIEITFYDTVPESNKDGHDSQMNIVSDAFQKEVDEPIENVDIENQMIVVSDTISKLKEIVEAQASYLSKMKEAEEQIKENISEFSFNSEDRQIIESSKLVIQKCERLLRAKKWELLAVRRRQLERDRDNWNKAFEEMKSSSLATNSSCKIGSIRPTNSIQEREIATICGRPSDKEKWNMALNDPRTPSFEDFDTRKWIYNQPTDSALPPTHSFVTPEQDPRHAKTCAELKESPTGVEDFRNKLIAAGSSSKVEPRPILPEGDKETETAQSSKRDLHVQVTQKPSISPSECSNYNQNSNDLHENRDNYYHYFF